MSPEERIANYKRHDSMRGEFGYELYKHMAKNDKIVLLTGDLGYGQFDAHREDFPDRFINCGASEQAMMGIACGLALEGKIPVVYSITTFLLYRPFETIRTYINGEKIPVKLIGGGRDKDYAHDGLSHWSEDAYKLFRPFNIEEPAILGNIKDYWPQTKEEIPAMLEEIINNDKPCFLSVRR